MSDAAKANAKTKATSTAPLKTEKTVPTVYKADESFSILIHPPSKYSQKYRVNVQCPEGSIIDFGLVEKCKELKLPISPAGPFSPNSFNESAGSSSNAANGDHKLDK